MLFGRFTQRAQKVLMLAQEEARRLSHPYVGTEHILLGLIREGEGVAAKALAGLGIDAEKVRELVEKSIGKGEGAVQEMSLTPRVKKVLELSVDEARRMGTNYVGTEHILLGLIREGEGVAAQVLGALGVEQEKVRQLVISMLGGPGGMPQGQQSQPGCAGGACGAKTVTLDQFGRDLTAQAREDHLDPVVGREKEIERVVQILSRRTKNNPVLIGDPGVGKTAIVEGLAQRIVAGQVPEILSDKRLVTLDLASLVAGTKYRGEFEDRLKKVVDEITTEKNIIVFIDELHTIIGAGAAEGAIDAANILKPALARGELQCIGATTLDEYRKHIERDSALERRFQPITVDEPGAAEAVEILKGLRDKYEAHHRVRITDDALDAAVRLSDRYITDRFLPDKAIDLMDEAGSRVRLQAFTAPPDLKELEKRIEEVRKEKESAVNSQEFEKAAQMRDEENKLRTELDNMRANWQQQKGGVELEVTAEDIAQIVASWTGIPVRKLAEEESERLLRMEEILHRRVIGQEEAVSAVARAIRRARAGLKDPKRPIGSFIFLGPSGVGKTELARALAEAMFGDEDAMVRIDMSEYMEKFAVSRLVGAPPGYVGYDEGGQLTEAVRRKPYSVVLLDEIEKAHPDVFNILLQVLEDGRLTDSKGRIVDFRNTVIIMTSNVGVSTIKREATLGFKTGDDKKSGYADMKKKITDELRRTFRPEFLNRVDEIIVFHPLSREHIKDIVGLMVQEVARRLAENEIEVEVGESAREYLAREGFDENYGARPLRRAIQKEIEDRLSEEMLRGAIKKGDRVRIDGTADGDLKVATVSGKD
ncbi:ATP-dependent Clp protease ATP-binding subunit ClpC [Desulfotomaculum arcticum]|uniref:ATP-dependent Clp protease ATP-binding subunit ClpC n=1 Tax=Desulfotruncus arcticus DSM 17038 TaxID=1121424 RepID=A0A1I2VZK7_9FIRM|nr:ATP-dependent Clp protease ATP-binding subunit [Desulfotruncus arcticus]SFG94452.1 ATP-dependent Clp protease ATP-binding subunit ClpC [Desulfotomaculum arcticum] [Desulfotruncus arcticus DSM 17038]